MLNVYFVYILEAFVFLCVYLCFFLALLRYNCDILCTFFIKFSVLKIYLFIWLCWVFAAACGPYLDSGSGGYSLAVMCVLLVEVASLVARAWALGCSRAQQL